MKPTASTLQLLLKIFTILEKALPIFLISQNNRLRRKIAALEYKNDYTHHQLRVIRKTRDIGAKHVQKNDVLIISDFLIESSKRNK